MDKLATVRLLIQPDVASDELLSSFISLAEGIVLNKRYPFGSPDGATVPAAYEMLQCQIAVELFSRRGAEGQISHSENGINRTWADSVVSPSLLKQIIPLCGSIEAVSNS